MKLQDGSGMRWLKQNVLHQITVPPDPTLLMNRAHSAKPLELRSLPPDPSVPHWGCVLKDVLRSHWSCLATGTTVTLHSTSLWSCLPAGATTTLIKNADLNLCGHYIIFLERFLHLYACFSTSPVIAVLERGVSPVSENPLRGPSNLLKIAILKVYRGLMPFLIFISILHQCGSC